MKSCLSCQATLTETDAHCPSCGQKVQINVKTLSSIVQDFVSNFLNFDNKLFQSLYHLFYPARLTNKYFQGDRQSYLTPIRLFFLSLIILYGLNASLADQGDDFSSHAKLQHMMMAAEIRDSLDLLKDDPAYAECAIQLDSYTEQILTSYRDIRCEYFDPAQNNDSFTFSFFSKQMLARDALSLSPNELFRKYDIQEWYDKFLLKQSLRLYKNSNGLISFIINNSLWGFVVLSLFMALFLKILFIRHNYYFVEHLVWIIHLNTFFFIISSVFTIILKFLDISSGIVGITMTIYIFSMIIYGLVALKRYYKQGWLKTMTKYFLLFNGYTFFAGLILIMILIISALIF